MLIAGGPGRAWATVVIAPEFPPVSDLVGNYGVSYVYSNSAIALGNTSSQTSSDGNSKTYYPSSPTDFLNVPDSYGFAQAATFPNLPITTASFHTYGSVGGGGVMKAFAEADGQNGTARTTTNVTVTFIDRMHVTQGGMAHLGLGIDGTFPIVSFGTTAFATGGATAQYFFFSQSIPSFGQSFVPTYYEQHTIDPTRDQVIKSGPSDMFLSTNSDWWVAGRLQISASANIPQLTSAGPGDPGLSISGVANFADTVRAHIDPSDDFSNLAYTTASGADYTTPVPEPPAFALAALGFVGAVARLLLCRGGWRGSRSAARHAC